MSETFLILGRIYRAIIMTYIRILVCSHYGCRILKKLEFSRQLSRNVRISMSENPSSSSHVVTWGRTDRHDDANSCVSQFCECA
jgi:hypothetical protein